MATNFAGGALRRSENAIRQAYAEQLAEQERQRQRELNKNTGGLVGGIGYLLEKNLTGFMSSVEGIWDFTAGGLAKLFGGDDWAESQIKNDWFGDWYSHPDEWYNPGKGWTVAGDVSQGIGTSGPGIVTAVVGGIITAGSGGTASAVGVPLIAAGVSALGAAGTSTKEAYQKTGELTGKEFGYGALSGATEGVIEGVSNIAGFGSGAVVKGVTSGVAKGTAKGAAKSAAKTVAKTVAKNSLGKELLKGFAGEALEEGISEFLSPFWERATYDPDAEMASVQEIAYASLIGGLSGMVMEGGNIAIDSSASFFRGNAANKNGNTGTVTELSRIISEFATTNNIEEEAFTNVRDTYNKFTESLKATNGQVQTVGQKKLLGDLQRENTIAVFQPMMVKSAVNTIVNADAISARLADMGIKNADGTAITADQLRAGIDLNNRKSVSTALKTNNPLRAVVAMDVAGQLMMDARQMADAVARGKAIASRADLANFNTTATPEEKLGVANMLGVGVDELATMDSDTLNARIVEAFEDGRIDQYTKRQEVIRAVEAIPESKARPIPPTAFTMTADGIRRYTDGISRVALIKDGDVYRIYDYDSHTMSRDMSRAEANAALKQYSDNKNAVTSINPENMQVTDNITNAQQLQLSQNESVQAQIDNFQKRIEAWDGKTEGFSFVMGDTPSYLSKIEINGKKIGNKQVRIDATKIKKIMQDHNEMTKDVIKNLPYLLNDPILVLDSKTVSGRLVLLGEVYANGKPVMMALEINPTTRTGNSTYVNVIKVASAYTRTNTQNLINSSNIRFINENKIRVNDWLKVNRLQLPLPNSQSDSVTYSLPQDSEKVNTPDEKNISKPQKTELSREALDTLAKENISVYSKLSVPNRAMVRNVLNNALANGFSQSEAIVLAEVSARSGVDVLISKKLCAVAREKGTTKLIYADGFYDSVDNRIVINPEGERSVDALLIHELTHAIYKDREGRYILERGVKNMSDSEKQAIINRYKKAGKKTTVELADELNAHYIEGQLGNKNLLGKLVSDSPTFADKVLAFFKGASDDYADNAELSASAKRLFKRYKKLFDTFAEQNQGANAYAAPVVTKKTAEGGRKFSLIGRTDDGRGIYKSNYPENTPKTQKQKDIINLVQNVWSKKPINLNLVIDGKNVPIEAKFNPELTERSDLSKIAFGNRKGTASEKRITMNLSSDLYQIAEESRHVGSKTESGKHNEAHAGVTTWHYFLTDLVYVEADGTKIECYMNIDVKQNDSGLWFYSFAIEKGSHPTDVLSAVTDKSATTSTNSIDQNSEKVNTNSEKNSSKRLALPKDVEITEENLESVREQKDDLYKKVAEAKKQADMLHDADKEKALMDLISLDTPKDKLNAAVDEYKKWQKESGYTEAYEKYSVLDKQLRELRSQEEYIERELSKRLLQREYTEEEVSKYASKAARKFHTTSRLSLAGYLTTNGSMLDFSEGQGYRVQDHREISSILDLPNYAGYSDGMIVFMNMGNIRLQTYGIDIAAMPNAKQISALRSIIPEIMREYDEFSVDFSTKTGNTDGSVTYPRGIATARIISDIKSYFETGNLPEQPSNLSQYRQYALPKDIDIEDLSLYNEIQLPSLEYKRIQSEALTWDSNRRNQLRIRTLSNGITYKYVIDNDSNVHVYDREIAKNIHERGGEYDNTSRKGSDRLAEELRVRQRDNRRDFNSSADGRKQAENDRQALFNDIGREKTTERARNTLDRAGSYGKKKKLVRVKFDEDASHGIEYYSDGSTKRFALPEGAEIESVSDASPAERRITEVYSKLMDGKRKIDGYTVYVYRDTANDGATIVFKTDSGEKISNRVELGRYMSNEQLFTYAAGYIAEYEGLTPSSDNGNIKKLLSDATEEAQNNFMTEFNAKLDRLAVLESERSELTKQFKGERFGQNPNVQASKETLNKVHEYDQQITKLTKSILQMEDEAKVLPTFVANIRKDIQSRNRLESLIAAKAMRMKDLKIGRFSNATQAESDTFKSTIYKLASIQYRGVFNQSGTRTVIRDLNAWYTSNNPVLDISGDPESSLYVPHVKAMLESLSTGKSKQFTMSELSDLYDVMSYFVKFVENYSRVYMNGQFVEALPLAEQFIDVINENAELKGNKSASVAKIKLKGLADSYTDTFLEPEALVKLRDLYNENGFNTTMFNMLREAAMNSKIKEMEVLAPYDKFLTDHKKYIENASVQTVEYLGHNVPRIQLIDLYMSYGREQAQRGLLESGIAFTALDGKTEHIRGILDSNQEYTDEQIKKTAEKERAKIKELLSDTDLEYAGILEDIYNIDAKGLKMDMDMKLYGFTNAVDGFYYPIRRYGTGTNSIDTDYKSELDHVSNAGFNKDTVQGAKQKLIIESADSRMRRHVSAVCNYAYLSPAIKAYDKLFNLDISGNANDPISVRTKTENTWKSGQEYFRKMLSDAQGIPSGDKTGQKVIGAIRGGYAKAVLGANPKVLATQMSSIFASLSMLDVDTVTKAAVSISAKDVEKYCPLAKYRAYENTAALAQAVIDREGRAVSKAGKIGKGVEKVSDTLMKPIGMVDSFVVRRLFAACQLQVEKNGGAKFGTEANKVEAGKLLTKVILETQQNAFATERSAAMRSSSEFMRTITMFTSDAIKVVGRVIDGFGEVSVLKAKINALGVDEKAKAKKVQLEASLKAANRKLGKSIAALVTSSLYMALIGRIFFKLFGKEYEEDESWVSAFVLDSIGNLIGGLPIASDIYSFFVDGYGVESFTYSSINDLLESASSVIDTTGKVITGDATSQDVSRAAKGLILSISQLTGLPVNNIYKQFYGTTKLISPETAYHVDEFFYAKNYTNDFYKAIENGDDQMAAHILSLTLGERIGGDFSAGVLDELVAVSKGGEKVLPREIPNEISINGNKIAITPEDAEKMQSISAQSDGALNKLFTKADYRKLNNADKATAINYVYELYFEKAVADVLGTQRASAVTYIDAVGADTMALLYLSTRGIESDKDKDGNAIAGSKRAKTVAAITAMNISKAEKVLLIYAKGYSYKDGDVSGMTETEAKKLLLKYILSLKVTSARKAEIATLCGFTVKNGRILNDFK